MLFGGFDSWWWTWKSRSVIYKSVILVCSVQDRPFQIKKCENLSWKNTFCKYSLRMYTASMIPADTSAVKYGILDPGVFLRERALQRCCWDPWCRIKQLYEAACSDKSGCATKVWTLWRQEDSYHVHLWYTLIRCTRTVLSDTRVQLIDRNSSLSKHTNLAREDCFAWTELSLYHSHREPLPRFCMLGGSLSTDYSYCVCEVDRCASFMIRHDVHRLHSTLLACSASIYWHSPGRAFHKEHRHLWEPACHGVLYNLIKHMRNKLSISGTRFINHNIDMSRLWTCQMSLALLRLSRRGTLRGTAKIQDDLWGLAWHDSLCTLNKWLRSELSTAWLQYA